MNKFCTICLCLVLLACIHKKNPTELNQQLKVAMTDYLNNNPKVKGKIAYEVKSVVYFEEANYYICEFKVQMTNAISEPSTPKLDTLGEMKVKVDKKFKVIGRYY